jgi:hypothetical protein
VAVGTEFRNVGARGLALKAFGLIHGGIGIVAGTVAAMAICAAQSVGDVNVILNEGGGAFGGIVERGVAGDAGIRGNGTAWYYPRGEVQEEENGRRSHLKYPNRVKVKR